ncbi:DUF1674-domain-containing protein [Daldinia caldariorum]|uniref:DUF1674-domain-containing protein n=1 Tax=Daldinia caldariorum TaxID=326644 RepID=UPI002008E4E6|nr:DUF1674-domain-containing protein [Daldinia caldariorum]KAI1471856.1 DUF1674-domain-containing protein [Daldinia caldariorum]
MASHLIRFTQIARPYAYGRTHRLQMAALLPLRHQRQASNNSNPFQSMPSPPRLPPEQQAEFERLQRTANTQEGFNPTSSPDFSSPLAPASSAAASSSSAVGQSAPAVEDDFASGPLRKGAPPEFEGDVNPKTGEVGGPKNEPLRWGPSGDYSFNGRVTDF